MTSEGTASDPPPGFQGDAAIVRERADALEIEAQLSSPGWVLLAESYDPGWQARVDGAPVRVRRADLAFRAVPVPAVRHRLELVYRPAAVLLAAGVSVVTGLTALLWLALRGRPDATPPPGARSNPAGTGEETT